MTWPIDIACTSRAERRLNADVADMAMKSGSLERENARLRSDMRDLNEALNTLRDAHAVAASELLQAQVIISTLVAAAAANPHQPLGRWVRLGNMAEAIKRFEGGGV